MPASLFLDVPILALCGKLADIVITASSPQIAPNGQIVTSIVFPSFSRLLKFRFPAARSSTAVDKVFPRSLSCHPPCRLGTSPDSTAVR
ncbi:hypothetical protein HDV63DRAFT_380318 [Trichoderma sp. SZMC 28014]